LLLTGMKRRMDSRRPARVSHSCCVTRHHAYPAKTQMASGRRMRRSRLSSTRKR
jgi:hypothetical protein